MERVKGISFSAMIYKITTTVDGGCNVTFSIPVFDSEAIKALFDLRERALQVGVVDPSDHVTLDG